MSEPISIAEIEALSMRDGKALLIHTEQIVTPEGIFPQEMRIIKNPKKIREKIGDRIILSIQWMDIED
jgi:hypothetical protein